MSEQCVFRRATLLAVLILVLMIACCSPAAAEILTVCPSGCTYSSIQDAIDDAVEGDTIEVMNGTYYECITLDKSLVLEGEGSGVTIINGNYSDNVVTITADDVVFSGFTVAAGHPYDSQIIYFGIGADDVANLSITQCIVTDCNVGIYIEGTTGLFVAGNEIYDNRAQGLLSVHVDSSQILSNSVHDNGMGLMTAWADDLVCTGNNLTSNQYNGLCMIDGVTGSLIEDNLVRDNCYLYFNQAGDFNQAGGYFEMVKNSTIRNNVFDHNGGIGFFISMMQTTSLYENVMEQNYAGFAYNELNLHPGNMVSSSNTVDGLPILYLEKAEDQVVTGEPFSSIYLFSCNNVTVRDMVLPARNGYGIIAMGGHGIRADHNVVSNNIFQNILFAAVKNGSITRNVVSDSAYGIGVLESFDVTASENTAFGNDHGMAVALTCSDVHLTGNTLEDNDMGISLEFASGDGTDEGISCTENVISGDGSKENGLGIHLMDTQGISLHHNGINGLYEGVWIQGGEENNVSHSSIENCSFGIEISFYSEGTGDFTPGRYNVITGNTVFADRKAFFTDLEYPFVYGNQIYLNSFSSEQDPSSSEIPDADSRMDRSGIPVFWGLPRGANLTRPALLPAEDEEPNILNTETPVTYKYQNLYFNGYLGNYWNWYNGSDTDGNGVGTIPYAVIMNNTDYYSLIAPADAYDVGPTPAFYANFTASPLEGVAPLTVQFSDTSDGNPILWLYKFGDGQTSTVKNPVHFYRTPGHYTVTLTIRKLEGRKFVSTTTEKPAFITVTGSPVPELAANFTAGPLSGPAPLSVAFTDTSTGSPQIRNYDFGDGITSKEKNPTHVYRNPGTYTVTQKVMKFERGKTIVNTIVKQDLITVSGQPVPGLSANFTAEPLSGEAPLSVAFTDTSTGGPQLRHYDFGDAFTSKEKNPTHVYRNPGTYTVTLKVMKFERGKMVANTTVKEDLIAVT